MSKNGTDELYEGLPDDAGEFSVERDGITFALKTRMVKGVSKPMLVYRAEGANSERKVTPSDADTKKFRMWRIRLLSSSPASVESAAFKDHEAETPSEEIEIDTEEEPEEAQAIDEAEWIPPFSYQEDGKAVEIWGNLVAAEIQEVQPEDENADAYLTMFVTVRAGNVNYLFDVLKGGISGILSAHDAGKWSRSSAEFHNEYDEGARGEELQRFIDMEKVLLWRVLKADERQTKTQSFEHGAMLTVRTKQWVKVTASDLKPVVEKALEGTDYADIIVTESDGLHGGRIEVQFSEDILFTPSLTVDVGRLGGQALRVYGGAQILACSNQLSADVRKEIRTLAEDGHEPIGVQVFSRKVHRGNFDAIAQTVKEVAESVIGFGGILESAKATELSIEDCIDILKYYRIRHVISAKTEEMIAELLNHDKIQQEPGSYYGLAMVLSYAGTHTEDLAGGVKSRLQRLAGEIVIVADFSDRFMELVKTAIENEPEEETKEEAETE